MISIVLKLCIYWGTNILTYLTLSVYKHNISHNLSRSFKNFSPVFNRKLIQILNIFLKQDTDLVPISLDLCLSIFGIICNGVIGGSGVLGMPLE